MVLLVVLCGPASSATAQVLRIGGFDFNARARTELIYSTNVERERPGVTSEEPEDYYLVLGMDLTSTRTVGRNTTLDLNTGIAMEKHFVRDDLDNSRNPFGHVLLTSSTEAGRLRLNGHVGYDRLSQSSADRFSPDGLGKARDPRTEIRYGAGATYAARRLTAGIDYRHRSEDHDEEQFADRNLEEDNIDAMIGYRIHERFEPVYRYEKKDNKFPDNPDGDRTQVNHRFILPFILRWEHPRLEYAFTWQKEDRGDGIPPEWKPRHMLMATDTRQLSPTLDFSWYAMYDNYPQPTEDQIQFTYGAQLRHQISRTANQVFGIARQPVETFGTTLKSDQTRYEYSFTKNDLFIYDLNLMLNISKQETTPILENGDEAEQQDVLSYETRLAHTRPVTPRLLRTLEYYYYNEDNSAQEELLTEHRVTLRYEYQF